MFAVASSTTASPFLWHRAGSPPQLLCVASSYFVGGELGFDIDRRNFSEVSPLCPEVQKFPLKEFNRLVLIFGVFSVQVTLQLAWL